MVIIYLAVGFSEHSSLDDEGLMKTRILSWAMVVGVPVIMFLVMVVYPRLPKKVKHIIEGAIEK